MKSFKWFFAGIFTGSFLGAPAVRAHESPQSFTLDGTLLASDHVSPLLDSTAKVRVQVLNPSKTCVLYDEEQTVNTLSSQGHFNIQVGSAVGSAKRRALDSANTMARVYQNASAIPAQAAPSQTCAGSSYTPVAGDVRYVRVIVTPTSSSPETLAPDMVLDSVPNAVVAQSLQGVEKAGFLQVNPSVNLSQAKLEQFMQTLTTVPGMGVTYDGTNFQSYDPKNGSLLSSGSVTDTQISDVEWSKVTSVPPAIAAVAGLTCANGEILKFVSGAWACGTESGVGVESDPTVSVFAKHTPGAGLVVNGSNQLVPDFGTTAGKVAQGNDSRFTDSRAPSGGASGDLSGSYPNPTVAKLQGRGVSVTAPADGQVLRYDNGTSTWVPSNFGIADLKKSNGLSQFVSASCTSSQTLIWSAVTDDFSCANISLPVGQVTGTLPIAQGGTGQTTAAAAFNTLSPLTVLGDTLYGGASGAGTRLAGNTTATKMFLSQTGTGSVSAAPVWSALSISDIGSGTLAVANGGTGATTLTDHGVLFGSGTGAVTASAAGSAGQILRSGGVAADPAWSTATYPATTTANGLLYSSAANTVGEIATANTGALVASSAGVPSWTLGSTANRVLRTNGTAITFSQVALSTDVTGTLPVANGGTGQTTATNAFNALAPSQTSQSGKFLSTNGTNTSWATALTSESDPKVGANTTNSLSKWDGTALVASAVTELGGNIGIGTTSPSMKLDVDGSVSATRYIGRTTATTGQATLLDLGMGGETLTFRFVKDAVGNIPADTWQFRVSGTQRDIIFSTFDSSPNLTIKSTGNIGIGNANPSAMLDVSGTIESRSGGFRFPDGNTVVSAPLRNCQLQTSSSNVVAALAMETVTYSCSGGYPYLVSGGCHSTSANMQLSSSHESALNTWSCSYANTHSSISRNFSIRIKCCQ